MSTNDFETLITTASESEPGMERLRLEVQLAEAKAMQFVEETKQKKLEEETKQKKLEEETKQMVQYTRQMELRQTELGQLLDCKFIPPPASPLKNLRLTTCLTALFLSFVVALPHSLLVFVLVERWGTTLNAAFKRLSFRETFVALVSLVLHHAMLFGLWYGRDCWLKRGFMQPQEAGVTLDEIDENVPLLARL